MTRTHAMRSTLRMPNGGLTSLGVVGGFLRKCWMSKNLR